MKGHNVVSESNKTVFLHKLFNLLNLWQEDRDITIILNNENETYHWVNNELKKVKETE